MCHLGTYQASNARNEDLKKAAPDIATLVCMIDKKLGELQTRGDVIQESVDQFLELWSLLTLYRENRIVRIGRPPGNLKDT